MTTKPFLEALEQVALLSEGIKAAFANALEEVCYKRGTVLLKKGEPCKTAYFMVNGMARLFYLSDESEVTNRFIGPKGVAISYYSYFSQKPSFEYIDLLEDSTLLAITKKDLSGIYLSFPELHKIMQAKLEQLHIESEERAMVLRMLSAKEKYAWMKERYPAIFQKASVEQIATFLGMSRETLSRIRSGK